MCVCVCVTCKLFFHLLFYHQYHVSSLYLKDMRVEMSKQMDLVVEACEPSYLQGQNKKIVSSRPFGLHEKFQGSLDTMETLSSAKISQKNEGLGIWLSGRNLPSS